MRPGLFITLEGGEGAGKSTQARRLANHLQTRAELRGRDIVLTREPGGTPGAEALRHLLLFGEAPLSPRAEILAHMAARADHLDSQILPALKRGAVVICDRFHDSTMAYQGYGIGRGDPALLDFIAQTRASLQSDPDCTILLCVPADTAATRLATRGGRPDRYEAEEQAFHQRVSAGFAAIARDEPERVRTLDGSGTPDSVSASILAAIEPLFLRHGLLTASDKG